MGEQNNRFEQISKIDQPNRDADPGRHRSGEIRGSRSSVGKAPGSAERSSQFYSAASLDGKPVPSREWLIEGLIPNKTVTLLSGDGGSGKSLLMLQLAVETVCGGTWLNKPVAAGGALFLSAEDDDDELHRRIDDIISYGRRSYRNLSKLTIRSLAGEDALLAVDISLSLVETELFMELEQRAAGDAPALIVIDTLADVYPANENDRAKVRQFIGILRGLALRQNCAVVLLGHPSLTGLNSGTGSSGSTAWNNSVRSRLYLSRIVNHGEEADPDKRVLTSMKANYNRIGDEISMRWRYGVFVADEIKVGLDKLAIGAKAQRVFLKLLKTFAEQGRRVNTAGGVTYAPKVFSEHPNSEGITKRAFKSAMETLLETRRIEILHDGPPSRRVSFLAEKASK